MTTLLLIPAHNKEYCWETRDAPPAHLLTKITSFPILFQQNITELESTKFEAGNYKWKVKIIVRESDYMSVKLCMVETDSLPAGWEVNAIFSFFIYNFISDNYPCVRGKVRRFHAVNSELRFSDLIAWNTLIEPAYGFLRNDTCIFGAEVFVIEKKPLIEQVSVLGVPPNPYKREWLIPEFSKLGSVWTSEEFLAEGYKWYIRLYPDGSIYKTSTACTSLGCIDAQRFVDDKKVHATWHFRLKNKLNNENDHSVQMAGWFSSTQADFTNEFIAIDDMRDKSKGFVVDDCCSLEIELSVEALQTGSNQGQSEHKAVETVDSESDPQKSQPRDDICMSLYI